MLKIRIKNFLENSFAASVFIRLHSITKKAEYMDAAKSALLHSGSSYRKYGYFAAPYANALIQFLFHGHNN